MGVINEIGTRMRFFSLYRSRDVIREATESPFMMMQGKLEPPQNNYILKLMSDNTY